MDKRQTARHEAGHALAHIDLGIPFDYVTIKANEDSDGHCHDAESVPDWFQPDVCADLRHRAWIEKRVMLLLAGPVAEQSDELAGTDYDKAWGLIVCLSGSSEQAEAYLEWLRVRVADMLELRKAVLQALTEALLERETLTQDEANDIFHNCRRRQQGLEQ